MDDGRTCRACGSSDLQPAGPPPGRRAVCAHCGRCWEDGGGGVAVDSLACPGCERRGICESCPTWLVEELSRREVLPDGQPVLIRPLLYGDRFELAAGFTALSPRARQHRFFNAPEELDDDELEYLTNLDYRDHFACAAVREDRPVPKGLGVARYIREEGDPTTAEVAVTVLDDFQQRGIGTLLTRTLGEVAAANGIRTFVNYVQWENAGAIDLLTGETSRITPAEPGVARIEVDLPPRVAEVPDSYLHRLIRAYAARVRDLGHLFEGEPGPPRPRQGRPRGDGGRPERRAAPRAARTPRGRPART